ncbi:hypothetical protein YC2023_107104 [Brassica napus]
MKTGVASGKGRRNADPVRVLAAFRGGADQVEVVCDACRSEGADASTWHAASLLDASSPTASVGLRLPGSLPEVVWTSLKSSGLHGSLLTKSLFHNRSECFGFSDLEDFWDNLPVSRLKYNALDDFQKVFQNTSISVVWTS